MKRKVTEQDDKNYDDGNFKYFIHQNYVLSRILKSNVDELKDMELEEIDKCLEMEENGRTVKGRDTEPISRGDDAVRLDSVFDLKIPGTGEEISVIVNVEGQNDPKPRYPLGKRAEVYVAKLVTAQLEAIGDRYELLNKVYSIWCILNPRVKDRNTIIRYRMKGERTFENGKAKGDPEELGTFNVIFVNIGSFEDGLPDALAIGSAMFKRMGKKKRRELVKDKFNIELNDEELERLGKMENIVRDKYEQGLREGEAKGRAEGIAEDRRYTMGLMADSVVSVVRDGGLSVEKALSLFRIPEENRAEVEAEAKRRLKQPS